MSGRSNLAMIDDAQSTRRHQIHDVPTTLIYMCQWRWCRDWISQMLQFESRYLDPRTTVSNWSMERWNRRHAYLTGHDSRGGLEGRFRGIGESCERGRMTWSYNRDWRDWRRGLQCNST